MGAEVAVGVRGERRMPTATSVPMERRPRGDRRRDDRGAVTAEAAAVLPALLAVTLLMVWLVSVATAQVAFLPGLTVEAETVAVREPE
jgi:hypothetical protein